MSSCQSKSPVPKVTDKEIADAIEENARKVLRTLFNELCTGVLAGSNVGVTLAAFNRDIMLIYLDELEKHAKEKREEFYGN